VELNNEFEVDRPIDETWVVLTDVERIAPCLPGAQLEEIEGDEYRGLVKIKVGPITAQYKGKATFVEKDDAAHRAVLKAEGRDSRGQGNASALITAQLAENGAGRTKVTVNTDLTVTGKVAQFGRGVMADVSEKLMGQFVTNLETRVLNEPAATPASTASASTPPTAPAPAAPTSAEGSADTVVATSPGNAAGATTTAPTTEDAPPSPTGATAGSASAESGAGGSPGIRKITNTEPVEPVDLLDATGAPLMKRLAPVLAIIFVLWVLVRLRRRHR
jgi:carbon monoxide dehydrogenase subunit G